MSADLEALYEEYEQATTDVQGSWDDYQTAETDWDQAVAHSVYRTAWREREELIEKIQALGGDLP